MNRGGPARTIVAAEPELAARGIQTLLLTGRTRAHEDDLAAAAKAAGIAVVELPQLSRQPGLLRDTAAYHTLRRLIARFAPDLIHSHTFKAGLLARALPKRFGPRIHTFHGHLFDGYFSRWTGRGLVALERALARRTDHLIAVSATTKKQLTEDYRIAPPHKFTVIPGVITGVGPGSGAASIAGMDDLSDPWVGCVGRLTRIKNPGFFLEVAKAVISVRPATHFVWVGDGELRTWFEAGVRRLGLSKRVHCSGWQNEPGRWHRRFAVEVLFSSNEGLPLSLLEARSLGVPVVATGVGGIPDLIADRVDGRVIRPCVNEAAAAVIRYLEDPKTARLHAEAARKRDEGRFSVQLHADRLRTLYERVLHAG